MYRNKFICVTDRKQCIGDFYKKIESIAALKPYAIILREKDLSEAEYIILAENCMKICINNNVQFFCNSDISSAQKIGCRNIQLSYNAYFQNENRLGCFDRIGLSIHSAEEAEALNNENISHIIAGHIYPTDCKKGIEPRGIEFLKQVCRISKHKVFAIGGIDPENYNQVLNSGANGFCIMSGLMRCCSAEKYMMKFK